MNTAEGSGLDPLGCAVTALGSAPAAFAFGAGTFVTATVFAELALPELLPAAASLPATRFPAVPRVFDAAATAPADPAAVWEYSTAACACAPIATPMTIAKRMARFD